MFHYSVLEKEVIEYLNISKGKTILDCTAGLGGHIKAILDKNSDVNIIGIDKDPINCEFLENKFKDNKNVSVSCCDYKNLDDVLAFYNIEKVDGILFDLGYCSTHVDDGSRGFSFKKDGPLDMRYNRNQALTAEDVVNNYDLKDLQKIFKEYGEESFYKSIAYKIVEERQNKRIKTTLELKKIIVSAVPNKYLNKKTDPATKVFQALRIEVNSELASLSIALNKAVENLKTGGRLCVISFHSLEDRIAKTIIKKNVLPCTCPKDLPICSCGLVPKLKVITKTPLIADSLEVKSNIRSRSAKLRVAERI
jgi:16S rRNA (cytosine1402-N4)-methyltransferase